MTKINPEFRDLLPPPNKWSDERLDASLKATGGPLDTIKVWKETGEVIDGHRRLARCKALGLKYKVEKLSFPDKEAVMQWMFEFEAGRRRMDQAFYDAGIAKMVADRVSAGQKVSEAVQTVAKAAGVSERTAFRAVERAERRDEALANVVPELQTEAAKLSPKKIEELAALPEETQKEIAASGDIDKSLRKQKAEPAHALPAEKYFDDNGVEVPESLNAIWRNSSKYDKACDMLIEASHYVQKLAAEQGCNELKAVGEWIGEWKERIQELKPSTVDGDNWLDRKSSGK